ncbi:glycosyltransferase [Falsiroseomonas sp. CW058]|uniref:glycosyltransferase n=1 Tax=Falsiroseomonas sp. CW058 TaxID=3388664 RepID=UPI003D31949C
MRLVLGDALYRHDPARPPLDALTVLLTRFNMVLPGFREAGRLLDEESFAAWLSARVGIFRHVCLRSVLSQRPRPDLWLIGFDAARRDAVRPVLDAIAAHDWIVPVWQETTDGVAEGLQLPFLREIELRRTPSHRWLVTTRLDNDDALNRLFFATLAEYAAAVQAARPALDDHWIVFPYGAQYGAGRFRLFPQTNNAFLSRVERLPADGPARVATVLQINHSRVLDAGQVFLPVTRQPMWLQFVHGGNVSNRLNPHLVHVAEPEAELARFGLLKPVLDRWSPAEGEEAPAPR